jgi:alginate O-acetyltransferase complex protein AlgI
LLPENFKKGLTLIFWGLVKKVVFADNIAVFANQYFANPELFPGSIPVFLATLAFGIQIYCDFSGYSDIAIGVAKLLGFELRLNFDKPYYAKNITEFWRKWHISLSSWLRDYLYIPLGGNRKGKVRTYINLMITMILGGLWHGAAWNFLFWGFYQGALLAIHKFLSEKGWNKIFDIFGPIKKHVTLLFTQYFVFLGWLIFRISDVNFLKYAAWKYVTFDLSTGMESIVSIFNQFTVPILFIFAFLIIHTYTYFNKRFIENVSKSDNFYWAIYIFVAILALLFLSPTETIEFIYFQF